MTDDSPCSQTVCEFQVYKRNKRLQKVYKTRGDFPAMWDRRRTEATVATTGFRFGDCELHLANRELLLAGQRVDLQPLVFDVLVYLLENTGRVVGKDELLDNVWKKRFVSDSVIARVMMKARKAIGDGVSGHHQIMTVHSIGYRFVGAVEPIVTETQPDTTSPEPSARSDDATNPAAAPAGAPAVDRRPHRNWMLRAGLPALALLAVILAIALIPKRVNSESPPRIAILPVVNATGDAGLKWAELGLMTLLGDTLQSEVPVVLAEPTEILNAVGDGPANALDDKRLQAIARKLRVNSLVLARLGHEDGDYRLDVDRFVNDKRTTLGSARGDDPADVAQDAGQLVVRSLAPVRSRSHSVRISTEPYINETYGRALDAYAREHYSEALPLLRVVAERVPAQLEPRWRLARSLHLTGDLEAAAVEATRLQRDAARQGNRLLLARALFVATGVNRRQGQLAMAERTGQQALALATPEFPEIEPLAYHILASVSQDRGKLDEARRRIEASIVGFQQMDSEYWLSGAYVNLGNLHSLPEIADLGLAQLHLKRGEALARRSGRIVVQAVALAALARIENIQGDCAKAIAYLDKALPLARESGNRNVEASNSMHRAFCSHNLGRTREALQFASLHRQRLSPETLPREGPVNDLMRAYFLRDSPTHSYAEVWSLFESAIAGFEKTEQKRKLKDALGEQASYAISQGRDAQAEALLDRLQRLVDGGEAGRGAAAIDDVRAMQAYWRGDKQRALTLLQKAATTAGDGDIGFKDRTARMAWVELDLGRVQAAAVHYGSIAAYENGHLPTCLVSARLLYEQRRYTAAMDRQDACMDLIGERLSDIDIAILDTYAAAATGNHRAFPQKTPPTLWL